MLLIILTSLFVSFGSYFLRKGDLFNLFLIIFQNKGINPQEIFFSFLGISLNLIGIFLWQLSSKLNIQFQVAWTIYLSLTLVFGYLVAYIFERNRLELNFYIGSALVIGGILILVRK